MSTIKEPKTIEELSKIICNFFKRSNWKAGRKHNNINIILDLELPRYDPLGFVDDKDIFKLIINRVRFNFDGYTYQCKGIENKLGNFTIQYVEKDSYDSVLNCYFHDKLKSNK